MSSQVFREQTVLCRAAGNETKTRSSSTGSRTGTAWLLMRCSCQIPQCFSPGTPWRPQLLQGALISPSHPFLSQSSTASSKHQVWFPQGSMQGCLHWRLDHLVITQTCAPGQANNSYRETSLLPSLTHFLYSLICKFSHELQKSHLGYHQSDLEFVTGFKLFLL